MRIGSIRALPIRSEISIFRPVKLTNRKCLKMREVQSSDAKAHLPQLLSDVERGETIVITRHGRAIARLVPEAEQRAIEVQRTMAQISLFRETMPSISICDILAARHEGHRY
ncbi:type II toxin-antitoxin system Phd/YefM family antitoxin [Novosphingobium sp. Fuku2-ISO-50]|uniref:type II toxin-antitoxin system Phd/YefM family antitoxin n=1 Tax=Novosphingobium sp. Fuku2-ISO-50 TaxID=1739114 RepID=UPI001E2F8A5A|nr:type II toxin-antitoxin system prevent-host-death family antitoxin [Novosphingobium sp. Fuku2-ISO-50]